MDIIPAIDIIDGKCVRLTKGDYNTKKIYDENPVEVAKSFEAAGLKRLHLVDLDGARSGAVKNWKVLEAISGNTNLIIDFSGGVSTPQQVALAFNLGATIIGIGSLAVSNKDVFLQWLKLHGADKFMLSVDVSQYAVMVKGWTSNSGIDIFQFISEYAIHGLMRMCCTDISKDGMLEGPAVSLYKSILSIHSDICLIASGGVSAIKDVDNLSAIGCNGVNIGKAIFEGKMKLKDLEQVVN